MTFDKVLLTLKNGGIIYRKSDKTLTFKRSKKYKDEIEGWALDDDYWSSDTPFDVNDLFADDWDVKT